MNTPCCMTLIIVVGLLFVSLVSATDTEEDLILSPLASKTGSEVMIIMISGAYVPASYYKMTMQAIQNASDLKLWIVVPVMPKEMCTIICSSESRCKLRTVANLAIDKAKAIGYDGDYYGPNVYVAGHSMGGSCANFFVMQYANTTSSYAGLIEMGSYVSEEGKDLDIYPVPAITIGAVLDGGLARPSSILYSLVSSDSATVSNGYNLDGSWQLSNKAVIILPSIDHSSFCPGFQVPGDIWPAEVDYETGANEIGATVGAWLDLNTAQSNQALVLLQQKVAWTRDFLTPLINALDLEQKNDDSPWCSEAQTLLSQLTEDQTKMVIEKSVSEKSLNDFERSSTSYSVIGSILHINISGYAQPFSVADMNENCIGTSRSIDCKMITADRIAEQLQLPTPASAMSCQSINEYALEVAISLLQSTSAGRDALDLHDKRGRPICFDSDITVNTDTLFYKNNINFNDTSECLYVQSLAFGPTPLGSPDIPGVQYCKFLSPARAIDYYWTDSLKSVSGCLNK